MSDTWPSFVFPSPRGSLPASTGPQSPYDDSIDRILRYLESAVLHSNNYSEQGFGFNASAVRTSDVIEPRWTEPDVESDSIMSKWVLGLRLFCLVCRSKVRPQYFGRTHYSRFIRRVRRRHTAWRCRRADAGTSTRIHSIFAKREHGMYDRDVHKLK
jgi:hypothetical protein